MLLGLYALGIVTGFGLAGFALATAIEQIERGRSIDAMLARLAARSAWHLEGKKS